MIEGLSPDWLPAVFRRSSRRSFNPEAPLDPTALERLEDLARRFRPFPEARTAVIRRPPDDVLKGIIGAYGRISGAHAYAAMIGRAVGPFVAERVGYTGQALVLEATVLGIGTCWAPGPQTRLDAGRRSPRRPSPAMKPRPNKEGADFDCIFPRTGYNNGPFGE